MISQFRNQVTQEIPQILLPLNMRSYKDALSFLKIFFSLPKGIENCLISADIGFTFSTT